MKINKIIVDITETEYGVVGAITYEDKDGNEYYDVDMFSSTDEFTTVLRRSSLFGGFNSFNDRPESVKSEE